MLNIGKRIAKARRYANLNQRELCKMIDMNDATLSRYENGLREPKADTIVKLSSALGVSTDYLLGVCNNVHGSDGSNDLSIILDSIGLMLMRDNLVCDGKPISKSDYDAILNAIKMVDCFARGLQSNK